RGAAPARRALARSQLPARARRALSRSPSPAPARRTLARSQPPAPARPVVARSSPPAPARPVVARSPSPAPARRALGRSRPPAPARALLVMLGARPPSRGSAPVAGSGLGPAPERRLRCRVRSGSTRVVRSFPRSEARRHLAAPAVHVASAKVLLGRQQIVGRTPKLQVVHAVRAAQRVRFAVVQLQPASLRTAPSSIVGVSTSPRIARPHLTPDRGAHVAPRRRGGRSRGRSFPRG